MLADLWADFMIWLLGSVVPVLESAVGIPIDVWDAYIGLTGFVSRLDNWVPVGFAAACVTFHWATYWWAFAMRLAHRRVKLGKP